MVALVRTQTRGISPLNSWRFDLTESAANTYTEQTVDTNLSVERGVIAEIQRIDVHLPQLATAADILNLQFVTSGGLTAMQDLDNINVLWRQTWEVPSFTSITNQDLLRRVEGTDFLLPIPYVAPTITLAIEGGSLAAAARVRAVVGYTLKKVSQSDYLKLLTALTR